MELLGELVRELVREIVKDWLFPSVGYSCKLSFALLSNVVHQIGKVRYGELRDLKYIKSITRPVGGTSKFPSTAKELFVFLVPMLFT